MSFNILATNLQLQDTTTVQLRNPATDEPLFADAAETKPLELVLFGKSSKVHRTWLTQALRRSEADQKSKKKKTADELLTENAKFFATMTKEIRNFDLDGRALDNKEAFEALYSDTRLLWIGEQVAEALGDAESFFTK